LTAAEILSISCTCDGLISWRTGQFLRHSRSIVLGSGPRHMTRTHRPKLLCARASPNPATSPDQANSASRSIRSLFMPFYELSQQARPPSGQILRNWLGDDRASRVKIHPVHGFQQVRTVHRRATGDIFDCTVAPTLRPLQCRLIVGGRACENALLAPNVDRPDAVLGGITS